MKQESRGQHTISEIRTQAESWEGVFRRIDRKKEQLIEIIARADEIICAGCGSAFNVSHSIAPLLQYYTGITSRAVHASDLMIHMPLFVNSGKKTLLIAFSRSGNTTESVRAVQAMRELGSLTLSVVCFGESRMAADADTAIVLGEAQENSVTTTRSFTAMVLAGSYLGALGAQRHEVCEGMKTLPALVRERMNLFEKLGRSIGADTDIEKYAFLGSGSAYGLAREAQLKFKEMVLLPSDSYVTLDFRHGPMSNVDPQMLVTLLVSDAGKEYELSVARKMKQLGGKLFVLCERGGAEFEECADYMLELKSGLGDGMRNVLYMPSIQFMAYERSLSRGQDPDNPKNLYYYVELEHGLEK
jgi:glucosamine--fructose-6-phosphate aminotransferase (isomerizing)